jgi:hypothetical protein
MDLKRKRKCLLSEWLRFWLNNTFSSGLIFYSTSKIDIPIKIRNNFSILKYSFHSTNTIHHWQQNKSRNNNNSPFDYYGQQQPPQQQQQEGEPVNDLSINAQLLKEILENQKNATPTNIAKTLRMFTLDEATFINQPNALHGLLHSMFNPVTAQAVFNLFMQMRPKFVQQAAMTGNANGIATYNLGDPQYQMQGGAEGYAARLAYEERREMLEERRFDKYMRNMMMIGERFDRERRQHSIGFSHILF